MNETKQPPPSKAAPWESHDEVLREVWRIRDELSAKYRGDLDRLFSDARERELHSGHPVVDFSREAKNRAQ